MKLLRGILLIQLLMVTLSSCGSSVSGALPPAPPVTPTISIEGDFSPQAAGTTRKFTAMENGAAVTADWMVVASDGGTIAADGTYTAPSLPGTFAINAALSSDASVQATANVPVIIPEGHIAGYDVGVDYHATGTDFQHTDFITTYQDPSVRQAVLAQVQGIADRGATFISTGIWFVVEPGTTNFGETWRAGFPMTDQEATNLHQYATDVAGIVGSGGNSLRLEIVLFWLGAADYTQGDPASGIGSTPISGAVFTQRVQTTIDKVVGAVSGVQRADKTPIVDTIYMDAEVMIGAKANEDWFLTTNYPYFISKVSGAGLTPAVYFIAVGDESAILDAGYVDSDFPVLNGHQSMYWVYRSMNFMVQQKLPLPPRIDFSCYLNSAESTYPVLLHHVLDDADATLPSLGAPKVYGAEETYYFQDPTQRKNFGQAFAGEAAQNPRMQRVAFWTTPDGGGPGINNVFPFAFEDYYPPPAP